MNSCRHNQIWVNNRLKQVLEKAKLKTLEQLNLLILNRDYLFTLKEAYDMNNPSLVEFFVQKFVLENLWNSLRNLQNILNG